MEVNRLTELRGIESRVGSVVGAVVACAFTAEEIGMSQSKKQKAGKEI